MRLTLILILLFFSFFSSAQKEIFLQNPSFEDFPRLSHTPYGWYDCGFPGESAVDVHPVIASQFQVDKLPAHGESYLGMIVRDNETWESIGQKLSEPLIGGKTYRFSIKLARSATYVSASRNHDTSDIYTKPKKINFATPVMLRIWGGNRYCEKVELLASSSLIINTNWLEFDFALQPKNNLSYISFEAFYQIPCTFPYNGNLLLDDASSILEMDNPNFLLEDSIRIAYLDSLEDAHIFNAPQEEIDLRIRLKMQSTEDVKTIPIMEPVEQEEFKEGVLTEEDRTFLKKQLALVKFEANSYYLENKGIDAVIEIVKKLNEFEEDLKISFCINTVESGWKSKRGKEILSLFLEAGIPRNNIRLRKYIPDIKDVYFKSGGYSDIYMCIY